MGPTVTKGAPLRLSRFPATPDPLHCAGLSGMRRPLEDRKQNARSGKAIPGGRHWFTFSCPSRNRWGQKVLKLRFQKLMNSPKELLFVNRSPAGAPWIWDVHHLWFRGDKLFFFSWKGRIISQMLGKRDSVSRKVDEDSPRLSEEAGTFLSFPA